MDGVSLGFAEKDGVSVLSDRYLWQVAEKLELHDRIVKDFVRAYTAEMISQALASQGYELDIQVLPEGIVIDAYR